uniref:Calreticulin n=1 Tax=Anolis carolinensis TaxID=28377 RepID=H9GF09_ANOCA
DFYLLLLYLYIFYYYYYRLIIPLPSLLFSFSAAKWQERWVPSQNRDNYGKFRLTAGAFYGDRELDKGLQTSENLKFYAISARFQPFSNAGRPLVLQYTVKHEQKMDCGGGYVKLFPADLDQRNMSSASPYYVMFGEQRPA